MFHPDERQWAIRRKAAGRRQPCACPSRGAVAKAGNIGALRPGATVSGLRGAAQNISPEPTRHTGRTKNIALPARLKMSPLLPVSGQNRA